MSQEYFKRKLTAILSADVVGYSRLMGADEEGTVRTLNKYKELIFSLVDENNGRVIDSPGDNVLLEFASVVDAAKCAVQIQKDLKEQNKGLPSSRQMEFRIGINIGDVIHDGDRIYGDGVNVAARIESLAEPGGICISRTAYDQVKGKVNIDYEYMGEYEVKNIKGPVRVYKIQNEKSEMKITTENKTSSLSGKPSIVVLPFVNMSNDPDQEYFSDGMAEEIIGVLAKLEGLKVISRTSAFFFKGKDVNLRTIGQDLNVEHVLEGSVRKAGNKIRVTAQLIKVSDDDHLWSENYDRELEDVFAIQDEISNAVVENLKVKLLKKTSEPLVKDYSKNIEAYELYLKAKFFLNKGFLPGIEKTIDYLERAIKTDPKFVPAYSMLADMLKNQATQFSLSSNEMWIKVKSLAQKAIEIDEMEPYTQTTIGTIKAIYEYDWKGAEIHYKRAIELNPSSIDGHIGYGLHLIGVGRVYEAIEEMKHGPELDPFSISANSVLCLAYYFAREFDKAIAQVQKALELSPNDTYSLQILALCYAAKGMYEESISILHKLANIPLCATFLGYVYSKAGKKEETQRILGEILERSKHEYIQPFLVAALYGGLGDKDKAFEWLEKGFEDHDPQNWCIKVEPMFDSLHSDPRWMQLMKKMNLAD